MNFFENFLVGFVEYDCESDEKINVVMVWYVNQVVVDVVCVGKLLFDGMVVLSGIYIVLFNGFGWVVIDV